MGKGTSYPPGEDKWFDLAHHPERSRRKDFHQRVASYQAWYNIVRVNSNKDYKSPWQIIRELNPKSDASAVTQAVQSYRHDNNQTCDNLLHPVWEVPVRAPGSNNGHN
jgi:hypothetical protein